MTEAQRLARRARQKQRRELAAQNPIDRKKIEHTEEVAKHTEEVAENTMSIAEQNLELTKQILEQIKRLADTDRRRFPTTEEIFG